MSHDFTKYLKRILSSEGVNLFTPIFRWALTACEFLSYSYVSLRHFAASHINVPFVLFGG